MYGGPGFVQLLDPYFTDNHAYPVPHPQQAVAGGRVIPLGQVKDALPYARLTSQEEHAAEQ